MDEFQENLTFGLNLGRSREIVVRQRNMEKLGQSDDRFCLSRVKKKQLLKLRP